MNLGMLRKVINDLPDDMPVGITFDDDNQPASYASLYLADVVLYEEDGTVYNTLADVPPDVDAEPTVMLYPHNRPDDE